jgi:hypothetical protein
MLLKTPNSIRCTSPLCGSVVGAVRMLQGVFLKSIQGFTYMTRQTIICNTLTQTCRKTVIQRTRHLLHTTDSRSETGTDQSHTHANDKTYRICFEYLCLEVTRLIKTDMRLTGTVSTLASTNQFKTKTMSCERYI